MREMEGGQPDLLLMESAFPDHSGLDLCRQLRRRGSLPILMVSQRGDPADRVRGLRAGADDFLSKPFDPDELLERVNALLRRAHRSEMAPTGTTIHTGDLRLNLIDRALWVKERGPISLTSVECRLLYAMMTKPGAVWSREALLQRLLDVPLGYDGPGNAIEAQVSRLRRKLERTSKRPQYLLTIRGQGYQLRVTD